MLLGRVPRFASGRVHGPYQSSGTFGRCDRIRAAAAAENGAPISTDFALPNQTPL